MLNGHSLYLYMKYTECIEYIDWVNSNKGIMLGLDSIRNLCEGLGNPQEELKFVHIAGTNGKGSTLAFISTILKESGYKVGRYISPTIREYRERIQINEKMISMKDLGLYMEMVKNVCDEMVSKGMPQPSSFEIETALSFLYFRDKKCDIVVLETGMGGITDATNIINNTLVSVLVSISMDHMQYLGNTIEEITAKKCGIIKPGRPVITISQKLEVMGVIENYCSKQGSELVAVDANKISGHKYNVSKQSFSYEGDKYEISLAGTWQSENAVLAINTVNVLRDAYGFSKITEKSIKNGLIKTVWPARFQIINKKPLFIIDGAHNIDAALRLRQTIDIYFADKRKVYIMGMFRDKEVEEVVSTIVSDGSMIFTCQTPNNPRAMSSIELADVIRNYNKNVTSCDSVEEAVEFATAVADNQSVIIACGSLSYLGKVIDIFSV